jgi:tetratricopeptide (TPR) repeat protein
MQAPREIPEQVSSPARCETDRRPAATAPFGRRSRRRLAMALLAVLAVALGAAAYRLTHVDSPEFRYRRALLALANDNPQQAESDLLYLQTLPDYQAHASLISGVLLQQVQRPDDALEEFRAAVEHPDTRALAWTLAGRTLLQQRRFPAAENALQRALSCDPSLAEAHRCLAAAYFEVGDMPLAMGHLHEAAESSPNDPRPHRFMGTIARSAGQNAAAIDFLRESLRRDAAGAMRMDPDARREVLLELAQLQVELLRHAEALESLRDVAETANVLSLRAECHYAQGDLERARECLAGALEIEPGHFASLLLRGRLALESNDTAAAAESLNRALQQNPLDHDLHYVLSQMYYRQGQIDLAKQHTNKAQELRDLDVEFEKMNRDVLSEPRNPLKCFRLGLMAERIGRGAIAAYWYRATLLLDPEHVQARERLSELSAGATSGSRSFNETIDSP